MHRSNVVEAYRNPEQGRRFSSRLLGSWHFSKDCGSRTSLNAVAKSLSA